jgi:hypothetical protein
MPVFEKFLKYSPPILVAYGFISSVAAILSTYANHAFNTVGMSTTGQYVIALDNYLLAVDQFFYYMAFAAIIWALSNLYEAQQNKK